jgi:hypothetical protein
MVLLFVTQGKYCQLSYFCSASCDKGQYCGPEKGCHCSQFHSPTGAWIAQSLQRLAMGWMMEGSEFESW